MKQVVIVSAARTPMGSLLGQLSNIPATQLGSVAIKGALEKAKLSPDLVDEVFMGNVLSAGLGQAPARQAALGAGIPNTVPCTTINKVCSSGLKATMMGAQSIQTGHNEIVVVGGMESMTRAPFYQLDARTGNKFGDTTLYEAITFDGLRDAYDHDLMGISAELCAKDHQISREEQDEYAIESYTRAANAWKEGKFKDEVVPVEIPQRKGDPIIMSEDEEFKNVNFEKLKTLRPAFQKDGTVTAANASTINDGGSALILMSEEKANELGIKPLAKIRSFADAAQEPQRFTTAPSKALPLAIERAGLSLDDISFFEINEAFAVVSLANMKLLKLDPNKVNVHGGAVSLGHPLGNSGSRILVTLLHILQQNNAKYGAAGICNGGGGASAMVVERIE